MNCPHGRCFSPLACGSFGYCRELNMQPVRVTNGVGRCIGYVRAEHDGWSAFTTMEVYGTFRTVDEAEACLRERDAEAQRAAASIVRL